MKINKANVVGFWELSPTWQDEARDNLDNLAEETMYIEPHEHANPAEHVLWDLSECMRCSGNYQGFEYNCSIAISNNSAMLINLSDDGEYVEYIFV